MWLYPTAAVLGTHCSAAPVRQKVVLHLLSKTDQGEARPAACLVQLHAVQGGAYTEAAVLRPEEPPNAQVLPESYSAAEARHGCGIQRTPAL